MTSFPNEDEQLKTDAKQIAEERVTSEELTRALARIEARKEQEAQHTAVTIPLGQAVEELGLAATPEEIFAEVQAQRRLTENVPHQQPTPSPPSPKPTAQNTGGATESTALTHCPACSRKLLTQASALCNWCGAVINDPKYQEQAAMSRQALDQQERQQVETVALEEARYGIYGRLKRRAKQNLGNRKPLG
jgi:hypothetical protein